MDYVQNIKVLQTSVKLCTTYKKSREKKSLGSFLYVPVISLVEEQQTLRSNY